MTFAFKGTNSFVVDFTCNRVAVTADDNAECTFMLGGETNLVDGCVEPPEAPDESTAFFGDGDVYCTAPWTDNPAGPSSMSELQMMTGTPDEACVTSATQYGNGYCLIAGVTASKELDYDTSLGALGCMQAAHGDADCVTSRVVSFGKAGGPHEGSACATRIPTARPRPALPTTTDTLAWCASARVATPRWTSSSLWTRLRRRMPIRFGVRAGAALALNAVDHYRAVVDGDVQTVSVDVDAVTESVTIANGVFLPDGARVGMVGYSTEGFTVSTLGDTRNYVLNSVA